MMQEKARANSGAGLLIHQVVSGSKSRKPASGGRYNQAISQRNIREGGADIPVCSHTSNLSRLRFVQPQPNRSK